MMSKKLLLFSASMLLFISLTTPAQQASSATPVAQEADSSPSIAVTVGNSSYLGIAVQEVTRENMGRYQLREPRGIVITRIADDGPAARAGLKVGDVILRFEGEQVSTSRKLQRLISEAAPEQSVRLGISRGGAEQEVSVTVGKRKNSFQDLVTTYPAQSGEEARRALEDLRSQQGIIGFGGGRRIGINSTQLTRQLADYFGVQGGVLVTSVAENSPAARAGLKAGDCITDVDGEKVESAGDLSRAINRRNEGAVNLRVVRDRNPLTISVTPEKSEAGAISIAPELLGLEPIEITMPTIDLGLPQIKPIKIKPIKIPQIKIKPQQLEMLRKLQSLEDQTML